MFTLNPYQEDERYNGNIPKEYTEKAFTLQNIDGMYSYVLDGEDNVYHFAAWTEVIPIK